MRDVRRPPARDAVRAAYDAAAAEYDQRHGDARSERRGRIIDAPQHRAAQGARRVLELGCGTGRLLARIEAPVRVGVDISPGMLARARQRGLAVVHADAHALPFADQSFDAILAPRGLFRYLDYERAFRECARVLAPGGRLAVHQYAARTWSLRDLVRGSDDGARTRSLCDLVRESGRGARTWSLCDLVRGSGRGVAPAGDEGLHVRRLDELYAPAGRAGLRVARVHLWRAVRVPPYALPVPTWLPGRFWSHCTVVFVKPDAGPDAAGARPRRSNVTAAAAESRRRPG